MIGKPIASLSSGLLARKGQARPAMRPQGFVGMNPAGPVEDLGWNDMGDELRTPAPAPMSVAAPPAAPVAKPAVLRQREVLDAQIARPEPSPARKPEPMPVGTVPVSNGTLARVAREVAARKDKAAFTLRLDQERHLRLRLASAVTGRSAQQLVTQALDEFLETLAEVEALARQVDPARDNG